MQTNRSIEPPVVSAGKIPQVGRQGPFTRLLGVVRGDKYMADAYEPAWSAAMERRTRAKVVRPDDGGALAVDVQLAVESGPIGAGHAAPADARPKER
jgi:hypothetical protein